MKAQLISVADADRWTTGQRAAHLEDTVDIVKNKEVTAKWDTRTVCTYMGEEKTQSTTRNRNAR